MGSAGSKKNSSKINGMCRKTESRCYAERMRLVQEEMSERDQKEMRCYKREVMVFALKEVEWKKERKRLREEVKRLKRVLEEKEERIREMEMDHMDDENHQKMVLDGSFLVEQMREERARRDEAVDKWKQLYLAIKEELDVLIQTTHHHGEGLICWRGEDDHHISEELKRELRAKQETIGALQLQLTVMEEDKFKREREIDILRQSLRIMSSKKNGAATTNPSHGKSHGAKQSVHHVDHHDRTHV